MSTKQITKEDVDQLALSIGQFIMKFEHLIELLRNGIMHLCAVCKTNDWRIVEILITDLPAETLLKKYEAMFTFAFYAVDPDKERSKLIKEAYDEVKEIIEHRNKVAHTLWSVEGRVNYETHQFEQHRLIGRNVRVKRHKGLQNAFDHKKIDPRVELNEWESKIESTISKILKLVIHINKLQKENAKEENEQTKKE